MHASHLRRARLAEVRRDVRHGRRQLLELGGGGGVERRERHEVRLAHWCPRGRRRARLGTATCVLVIGCVALHWPAAVH